jgi:tetratricopeptide (TPR) repeat protein
MRSRILIVLGLLAVVALVYLPVSRFGFVEFDDPYYVYDNPHLAAGLCPANLTFAFTSFIGANWNPLVWLSFELDQMLFHLNPHAMHVENVVLHGITTVILFLLLAEATGCQWRSATVAALFAVHPMHVESVAWISERKDVLSTPLLFAAIAMYVRYARSKVTKTRAGYYAVALLLYALSLSAKSMGVTLAGILLLLDLWPLQRSSINQSISKWKLLDKLPFVALAAAASIVTMIAQRSAGAITALPFSLRISNAVVCMVIYISKLVFPTGLAVYYPLPSSRPVEAVVACAVLILLITAIAWRLRRNCPYLLIGWLWFVGTLLPVIGLVQVGGQAMADRYSYLPSVGLFIAIVWGALDLIRRVIHSATARAILCSSLAVLIITAYAVLARRQTGSWQNNQTLFARALDVTDGNTVAAVMLGRDARLQGDPGSALSYLSLALRFNPNDADAHDQVGLCLADTAPARAIGEFESAVRDDPKSVMYRLHLADELQRTGKLDAAIQQCRNALATEPQSTAALHELSLLLARTHQQ